MDERAEFDKYYSEILEGEELPEAVTTGYQILRCLRRGEGKELYLAADRQTYRYCVIKLAYGRQREFLRREAESLRDLWAAMEEAEGTAEAERSAGNGRPENAAGGQFAEHGPKIPGIVRIYEYIEGDGFAALVREYCEGVTLKQLTDRRGRLTESEAAEYGVQICGLLDRMHRMTPPMIHRDVKPENLLVTADGQLVMLDFDTARRFQPEKERDTVFVGSKDTAAPEQFGFSQTDVRTDIYGAGRTLLYLLCGSFEERQLDSVVCSRRLKQTVRRAVAFEPDRRQQQAGELLAELKQCENGSWRTPTAVCGRLAVSAGIAGVLLGAALAACGFLWKGTGGDAIPVATETESEILLFNPEAYREELDRAVEAYRSRDYETLGDASRQLVEQLYNDPALSERAAEDRELFESDEFSEDMIWRGEVSMTEKLNYRLWNEDDLLLRKLDKYQTSGKRIADTMDEMLNAFVEDGVGIGILYNYIFSEDTEDLRTADILWDYLSVLTTSVFPL